MNLSLPSEIQKVIDERVKSGSYRRAEDVVAAAVVSLGQQERAMQLTAAELEAVYPSLREKLAEGLAAADAGKLSDGDAFFDELEAQDSPSPREPGRKTA
jgi:Arc/MetJ-type ribon-helix-helix transcriptional regulator